MSQIDEFRRIAKAYGRASFVAHVNNYFDVTGRLADNVAIRSLTARLNRELRKGGKLQELAGVIVQPSEQGAGKTAAWTVGHEAADDAAELIDPHQSKELEQIVTLVENGDFDLPSTKRNVEVGIARTSTLSRTAQRDIANGYVSLEFERRAKDIESAAKAKLDAVQESRIEELSRALNYVLTNMGGGGSVRGNGRSIVRRDEVGREAKERDDDAAGEIVTGGRRRA